MQITMITAALLGLLLLALSIRVTTVRRSGGISLGDGGRADLLQRIRAQANFVEYAPLALILLFLCEQAFGGTWWVGALAATLVLGRILHAVGMALPAPNAPRVIGMICTWTPIAVMAWLLLYAGLTR